MRRVWGERSCGCGVRGCVGSFKGGSWRSCGGGGGGGGEEEDS